MKAIKNNIKIKWIIAGGILAIIGIILFAIYSYSEHMEYIKNTNPELAKAMTYEEVQDGDEIVEGTNECVNFDAFFLRDLDGDGYAESIRGTSKEIGKEDTLYMELNVQTEGVLKDAKITVNGENFYLQTALPKDNELKDNYIGNNIKSIEFNELSNGTQKLLTGIVKSGDYSYSSKKAEAIGNNINNYSKVNSVTLTGTYVGEDGTETPITKTVEFNIDWYGQTKASISTTNQSGDLESAINEEEGTINLNFTVNTQETEQELILSKNHVEGKIPELNGYAPTKVEYTGSNVVFNYAAETRTFTLDRSAQIDEQGNVTTSLSGSNSYGIKVTYPLEAYQTLGAETVQIKIPVKTYYEGYNNPSEEFTNPYKSNPAQSTVVLNYEKPQIPDGEIYRTSFDVTVGKQVYSPSSRYIVSKEKPLKIYNGISEEEKGDTYTVTWRGYVGTNAKLDGMIMKETKDGETQVSDQFIKTDASTESVDDVVSNVGIYFSGADTLLGEDGWIKVYDEDTGNLIVTFTQSDWNKYTSSNPYKYEIPVKHIRIETSALQKNETSLYVYNIKEIDDEKITEKYEREEFDTLQYIKSTLVGYIAGEYVETDVHQANYEAPMSIANIRISNNTISTQVTEMNEKITIEASANTSANQVAWQDGTFLVKLPAEIIDVQINDVTINNSNVNLESYELIEENEERFIKIVTKNDTPQTYTITVDVDLTPDPRIATTTKQIELYASNENGENYYYKAQDIYDVDNDLNVAEQVNYRTTSISMISPNSLLTNQTASNYDDKGSIVISPQIADIRPIYAVVDQENPEEQTATIGVQIKNNYASTISEIELLGKIPFEGNTYVISGGNLGSTFTTKMTDVGITVPEALEEYVTVYYSENENPDRDLSKAENEWKTAEQVENWDNIKTYLIDLGNYVMPAGTEYVFNYTVKIPNGLEFNKVSYSHHGIYFCLDTEQGKYRTQTEPNRIGLRIAEKYNLELTKYQTGKDKLIPGATYSITDVNTGESKTGVTNAQGKLTIANLYAEKEYEIKEIKTPDDYELNSDVIRFIGHVDEDGVLTIEKKSGTTRGDFTVTKEEGEEYKVTVNVEDEVKASIKIIKKEEGTETLIQGAKFKLTGYGLSENGKTLTTNINGEITFRGLSVNQEYTLSEVKAEGYYLASPIKFKVVNNDGNYTVEKIEDETAIGEIKEQTTIEEDGIPTINITIEDEKIPTYDLQIIKVKKTTESTVSNDELIAKAETALADTEVEYLEGAKFKLYKGTEEIGSYTTGSDGKVTITGLYQYESDKNIDQTYTLKEVLAPEGYAKVKDITFKAEVVDGALVLKEINEGEESDSTRYTVEGNTISLTIEDSPSFKLIKKDAETQELLAGVKFAIYNVENGEVPATNSKGEIIGTQETINGKEYYTVTTDENGEITADLTEGLYKAVEVEADEKYDLTGQTYYFGIGASREAPTTIGVTQATSVGGSGDDRITSVAGTDDDGYIVGGYFASNSIQVGVYVLTSNGSSDGMIIKYDAEGEVEWARSIGGSSSDYIRSVASTSSGGYIVGGYFSSSIQVGEHILTSNGSSDGMIIKYDANGEVEWARSVGGSGNEQITSIASTSDGGYIVGGYFESSSIQVGTYTLTSNGASDGMIIKYDAKGEVEWARNIGGSSGDYVDSVAETNDGGYIAGGYFKSRSIQVGEYKFTGDGSSKSIIIKYNIRGEVDYANSIVSDNSTYINSVSATTDGGYLVGGQFYSRDIKIGEYTLRNKGAYEYEGMVIKYSSSGEVEWATSIGGQEDDYINSIAPTNNGGFVVVGESSADNIEIGNFDLLNSGSYDGIIVKYSNKTSINMELDMTAKTGEDIFNSIKATNDGGYIVGGTFNHSITVGDNTFTSNGLSRGILVKYNANNTVNWAIPFDSKSKIDSVTQIDDGDYIAVGEFTYKTTLGNYILTNNGGTDGMIIKYDSAGNVKWATSIGGSGYEHINIVETTNDGGYIVGGYFNSNIIQIGEYTLKNDSSTYNDMLIKYNRNGEVEWVLNIGENNNEHIEQMTITSDDKIILIVNDNILKYTSDGKLESMNHIEKTYITSVAGTDDGGYIIGGSFSGKITIGNYTLISTDYGSAMRNGVLIKYNREGEVEWAKKVGGGFNYINSIMASNDGGIIVQGNFSADIQIGDYILTTQGKTDGIIIKYNREGEVEWAKKVGGSDQDYINSVREISDGAIILGGNFYSGNVEIGNDAFIENTNNNRGLLLRIYPNTGVPEIQELSVENNRKEFEITTDVKEIDGIKGGEISGEDRKPYETVKYGDSSTKEIVMTPDTNYEIIGITVNGEEYLFEENEDGTYTMPQFDNVTEDKHIEVTYALKDNKLTINKVDSQTQEPLAGATFKLDQLEERNEPDNDKIIGEIVANGETYYEANKENEITEEVVGELTNNGTYYFVENEEGTLTPTNSKTYQVANVEGATSGVHNTTANSYVEIDLTGLEGKYIAVVNANVSSQSSNDYGYATISQTTNAPSYNTNNSSQTRFMYISGTSSSVTIPSDYTSKVLEGGNVYYLHLGYRKNGSVDTGDDQVVINSIKVYGAKDVTYNFVATVSGGYESNNQGKDNTTANSYIPIDLTNNTGKYNLTVNAEISSQSSDYGYATVTSSTDRVSYNTNNTSSVRFVYISGEKEAQDYTTVLQGGQMYYLHLGYYKNSSTSDGVDKFTVNDIKVSLNDSELYHTEVTTNSEGQGIVQIPFGKYQITETKAPEGYELNEEPIVIEFRADGDNHEITIENQESAKVIVHHYLKNNNGEYTTEKVAEDELLEGKIGTNYTTTPYLDLEKYELEKDAEGNYVIPEGASGIYESGTKEIIYYYEEKEIPLTVHHYIEGTTTSVPLKDGGEAEDVTASGKEGEEYTTNEISDDILSEKYELVSIPENAVGTYSGEEVIVTYYYKQVERPLTIIKTGENEEPLEGVKFEIQSKEEAQQENEIGKIGNLETNGDYYFIEQNGKYISNNQNQNSTTANSYIKIDLTDKSDATIKINAEISSQSSDYGYATITGNTSVPSYDSTTGRIFRISGQVAAKDYETTLAGGKIYYLHLCYYKNYSTSSYNDTFTINRIEINGYKILNKKEYTTNQEGKITTTLPVGEYVAREVETPKDYELPEEAETEFAVTKQDETITLNITNQKKQGTVITHHYIEGTTDEVPSNIEGQVVEEVIQTGKVGDIWATKQAENVSTNYEFVRVEGNASGEFTEETQEVIYYYRAKATSVLVHHYKEGTTEQLSNDVIINGKIGDSYTTQVATDIPQNYELVATPANATGSMTEEQIVVTYYYRLKTPNITNQVINKTGTDRITVANQEMSYTVTYTANVTDYIGNAEVTIVDTLPYAIDEAKSDLAGGTYDSASKTITWKENVSDINSYTGNGTVNVTKTFKVVYVDLDMNQEKVVNNVKGNIKLLTPEKTSEEVTGSQESTIYKAIISSEKLVDKTEAIEGEKVTYTVRIKNEGNLAKTVTVRDTLPAGITFDKDTLIKVGETGTVYTEQNLKNGIPVEVPANGSIDVVFAGKVDTLASNEYSKTLTNQATVDNEPTNEVTTNVTKANITAHKESDPASGNKVRFGDEITYRIRVRNDGTREGTAIIKDTVPTGTTFVEGSVKIDNVADSTKTATDLQNGINVTVGVGAEKVVEFKVTVNKLIDGTKIKNTAYINQNGEDKKVLEEPEHTYVEPKEEQNITKTGTTTIESLNGEITYNINYTARITDYSGRATVKLVDKLPYAIDEAKSDLAGGTYDAQAQTITWEEAVEGIQLTEEKEVTINKTIKVVYTGITQGTTSVKNVVTGHIEYETPVMTSDEVTANWTTTTGFIINIPVSKVWEDDSNKLGQRPTKVVFKLHGSDGSEYIKEMSKPGTQGSTTTQDSTNPNKWNDIFENLPKYDSNNQEIVYTLTEEEKTEGDLRYYDSIVTDKTVTNTNKYGKVTVHHYIMNTDGSLTTTRVPDVNGTEIADVVIEGKEGDPYTTAEANNINEKYELVAERLPANATGTIEKYNEKKPQEVIYYYRLKPAKVLINYLEKDEDTDDSNNLVLTAQEKIDGHVDDSYNTDTDHRKETIEKDGKTYTLVSDSGNKTGNMTLQDITVTYYYLQNTKATVRYVERNPETHEIVKDLEEPTVKEGLVGDEFVTNSKEFVGYKLVESPEKTTIEMTKEEQTLIYYYEPVYTGLIENHIDDKTGKVLYTETHDVQVGEDYDIPSKEFEGYDLVESKLPENAKGTMGEELVTVNYYYIKKAVLEVNYIDKLTGEPLTEQIVDETKHEGDNYSTEEKVFENYDMIKVDGNKEGTLAVETDEQGNITNNRTVVTYYYAKKSAGVEEHHIDILTGEDIEEPTLHEGHVGDEYDIKAKEFLSYKLVEADEEGNSMLPENSKGTMTEEKIVVNYYYNQPAKVIVHYVEKATGKELEETNLETGELQKALVIIEGFNQDEYETTAKEFEYYTLIEKPEEEQGKMKVEIVKDDEGNDVVNNTIELYYYYEAKPFNIGVDKEITGIAVNGERREPTNGKLEKVEIYRKSTEETSVQVEYKIKVSNTGEVSGNATIEENIPDGMSLANNDGTWEEQEGKLIKVIPELGAGETKEYTVLLNWEQSGNNMGEKANEVKLVETGNVPGFVDNNDKDNTSNANVIISVETGELPIGLILALVALVGLETVTLRYAVVLTKRQKKKVNKK